MAEKIITVESSEQLSALFGQLDGNVANIKKQYNVNIVSRDGNIKVIGDEPPPLKLLKQLKLCLK